MSKNLMDTTLSFRISKLVKNELLVFADNLTIEKGKKYGLADVIKIALQNTWGINLGYEINDEQKS